MGNLRHRQPYPGQDDLKALNWLLGVVQLVLYAPLLLAAMIWEWTRPKARG